MKFSINFYLEKRKELVENVPILVNVAYNGKRMKFYTGKRCDMDQWNGEKVVLKKKSVLDNGQSANDFNFDLNQIEIAIRDLFKIYDWKKISPSTEQLREDLKIKLGKKCKREDSELFFDRLDRYITDQISDNKYSKRSMESVKSVLKKYKPDLSFSDIDLQFITDFHNWLIQKRLTSENTATSYLKRFNTVLKYSVNHGRMDRNPFANYKIEAQVYGKPVYLTIAERDILLNTKIDDPKLEKLRDIFVLQCLIGCRIGDLKKLTKANVINGNLEYIASKTKDHDPRVAVVPLSTKALSIINKYNLPDGKLLPYYRKQDINVDLKILLEKLKITRSVIIPDKKTRQGIQVRICDIVSTHMARRVFIGGLYKKGVKDAIIASMSGHVKDSKAFGRYYDVDIDDQKAAISLID